MNARQRAEAKGYVFWPVNPMPTVILTAQDGRRRQQADRRRERIAHPPIRMATMQRTGTPLTDKQRVYNYVKQGDPRRPLTARQHRRRRHKAHRLTS